MKITAKSGKVKDDKGISIPASIDLNLGATLAEAVSTFGEEVVFKAYLANAVIGAQNAIRAELENGVAPADMQAQLGSWKPGEKRARKPRDPKVAAKAYLEGLSPKERTEFFKQCSQ